LFQQAIESGLGERMALFLWEGRAVFPENFERQLHDLFPHIFTWDDDLVSSNPKYHKFYLPYPRHRPGVDKNPFNNRKLLVNISINRNSDIPGELYSERRKAISYFTDCFPYDFDLYGPNWDKPTNLWQRYVPFAIKKYDSYRGQAKPNGKQELLANYKFSLCYENYSLAKGYVTEKIFDCLRSGAIPIYWGAENIDYYVDPTAFIDRRDFKDLKDLGAYIASMDQHQYNGYVNAAEQFLKTQKFKHFLSENFTKTIIKFIKSLQI
jgi:hypothetical protein